MNRLVSTLIGKPVVVSKLAISLLVFCAFVPAFASAPTPPNVVGTFELTLDEGLTRHIEFQATRSHDGAVSGEVIFRDGRAIDVKKSSEESSSDSSQPFFFKADIDCLIIDEHKAIMSGSIKESSSKSYVGRRILVVAQDNGGAKDPSKRDRLTWGIYRSEQKLWATLDAERPDEQGTQLTWIATDSERTDDEGVSSDHEKIIGCKSFPLSAYSFHSGNQIRGTVTVRP